MYPKEVYSNALEKEFALSYARMGSVLSWQAMPVRDRDWHFEKLVEVKREERKRAEEDAAKVRAASNKR